MKQIIKTAATLLVSAALFTAPTAYAEQETNCLGDWLSISKQETQEDGTGGESSWWSSLWQSKKNGFEVKDGYLYHYTDGELDTYESGFVEIDGGEYHVAAAGNTIDTFSTGFVVVDDVLCHVSVAGGPFDQYEAGFTVIDGKLCHISQAGCVIDRYAAGTQEIDGSLYYSNGDGSFLTDGKVGYLYFGADGRYTSGNATLDGYVDQALAACTNASMTKAEKLHAAYLYVRDNGAYLARPHQPRGSTAWAEESALFMFEHKRGNCYCFAAQFLYLARRIGYDAYPVSGGVGHNDSDHAWVMIPENGKQYIYDVELEWGYRVGKYGNKQPVAYNMYKMPLNKTVFTYQFP